VSEKLNSRECQNCKGTGNVFDGWEDTSPCPDCGGSGSTPGAPQAAKPELVEAARAALPQFEELVNEYHGEDRDEDCYLCSVLERLRRAIAAQGGK
jgi:hypothetical protein